MVSDVLGPACRKGGGRIVLVTTSPDTVEHPFWGYYDAAQAAGRAFHRTIDCMPWDASRKAQIVAECGGVDSPTYQREYMGARVQDSRLSVVPEWTAEAERKAVQEVKVPRLMPSGKPPYCSCGALDPGVKDHTGYICGYYDFRLAKYVVTGEFWGNQLTTDEIVAGMRKAEGDLVIDNRVSDTSLQIIIDLQRLHGMSIRPVVKDTLPAMVNYIRVIVKQGRLVISDKCPNIVRHMRSALWDKNREVWRRSETDGHYDLLAALMYWVRSIDTVTNPLPVIPWDVAGQQVWDHSGKGLQPGDVVDGWEELADVL
jgi:hypothetical protein